MNCRSIASILCQFTFTCGFYLNIILRGALPKTCCGVRQRSGEGSSALYVAAAVLLATAVPGCLQGVSVGEERKVRVLGWIDDRL